MMLRKRSLQIRGQDVHLRELTDLVALRRSVIRRNGETDPPTYEDEARLSDAPRQSEILNALPPDVSLPEVRALEANGWIFIPRGKGIDLVCTTLPKAKIFIKP